MWKILVELHVCKFVLSLHPKIPAKSSHFPKFSDSPRVPEAVLPSSGGKKGKVLQIATISDEICNVRNDAVH